jgi:hypothetical protein
MTVWAWIGVGVGAFLALSLLVSVGIAGVLGRIGEEIAHIQEAEPWASAPLTRETREASEAELPDTHTTRRRSTFRSF